MIKEQSILPSIPVMFAVQTKASALPSYLC